MILSHQIESFRFWDIVTLWAQEQLLHEEIVARALAASVVKNGLILNSVDTRWLKDQGCDLEFNGKPLVAYWPEQGSNMLLLRKRALDHLIAVVFSARTPSRKALYEEYILRSDLEVWLEKQNKPKPLFWFG